MATSVFILNRLRLWAMKQQSVLSSSKLIRVLTLKTHGILRLALIPVWNEQNQPSFIKQSLLNNNSFLPIVHFSSKNSGDSDTKPKILNQTSDSATDKAKGDVTKEKKVSSVSKETKEMKKSSSKDINESKEPEEKKRSLSKDAKEPEGKKGSKQQEKEVKEPTADDLSIKEIPGDLPKVGGEGKVPLKSNDDDEDEKGSYIALTRFPEIIWPGLWKLCKNLYVIHFVIHVNIDPHFDPREFLTGAREAVSQISNILSEGKIESLKGYVTDDVINEIKPNLNRMNLKQRHQLEMKAQDIYVGFIDLVEVTIDTSTIPNKKFIEITCCFHSLRDLMHFKKMYPETTFYNIMDHKDRISIGNYRFIRDYTEGSKEAGHWMINKLNHFQPLDLPEYS